MGNDCTLLLLNRMPIFNIYDLFIIIFMNVDSKTKGPCMIEYCTAHLQFPKL